jgi:hypothetical protein
MSTGTVQGMGSSSSQGTGQTAQQKSHNSNLVKEGRDLILDLNASDKQVYDFLNRAISSDDTSPQTMAILQQFLQKRAEKAGLLTEMLRKFGETAMRVIGNIGR